MNYTFLKKKSFWQENITQYIVLIGSFAVAMLMGRCVLLLQICIDGSLSELITGAIFSGLIFDAVLLCNITALLYLPYLFLYLIKKSFSLIICDIFFVVYIIVIALLYEYLLNTTNNLDHIVCIYSINEIIQIVLSSASVSIWQIIRLILQITFCIVVMFLVQRIKNKYYVFSLGVFALTIVITLSVNYQRLLKNDKRYESLLEYKYAVNQLSYLILDCYSYNKSLTENDMNNYTEIIENYKYIHPTKTFVNSEYPLLHKFEDSDVLGSFLDIGDSQKLPNFVFIIVESMGQQYTGFPHTSVPLMPFVDSLKTKSLYWPNCLSTAERTFAVLPSVLASAPHGSHGFASDWTIIPDHNSIITDLFRNGYNTSYFYGGDNTFDGQQDFLSRNNFMYIMDARKDTSASYYIEKTHRWGMDDAEMFRKAIEYKNSYGTAPFVDVYQTLSTHEPCIVPDKKYEKRVKEGVDTLHFSCAQEGRNYRDHLNMYACFLYTDDCIRWLFHEYKKRKDYENTIFVILGDHRMGGNVSDVNNPIQKYHVPLIIYSPLLKSPRTMYPIVSHWDIAPTINAFLQKNYPYSTDSICHWLGKSLDTNTHFRSNQTLSFMLNNRNVEDLLLDTLFLSKGRLYSIDSNMCCHINSNEDEKSLMEKVLDVSNSVSQYVCSNDKIIQSNYLTLPLYFVYHDKNRVRCKKEFSSFSVPFPLKTNVKYLYVDVSFDYYKHSSSCENPDVVVAVKKGSEQIYYKKWSIPSKNANPLRVRQHTTHKIYTDVDTKDSEVSIYLWNKNFCDFSYENVTIKVYCE